MSRFFRGIAARARLAPPPRKWAVAGKSELLESNPTQRCDGAKEDLTRLHFLAAHSGAAPSAQRSFASHSDLHPLQSCNPRRWGVFWWVMLTKSSKLLVAVFAGWLVSAAGPK